jgi:glutamate synthase (NADPH) large chain
MGTDTPLAVLSNKPKLLFNYFKQNFAQVTNPPIDPIREELVMSLVSMIGPRPNLLGRQAGTHKRLEVAQPILTNEDLEKIRIIELLDGAFRTAHDRHRLAGGRRREGMARRSTASASRPSTRCCEGHNILILSDRAVSAERIAIPALLATAAVHHHLIRAGPAHQTGLVVETGEAREVHHFCVLAGYGAEAINPYLAFETLEQIRVQNSLPIKPYEVQKNYIKAVGKGCSR